MVCETGTFSVSSRDWTTVYAVAVFLTKKMFDFNTIPTACKDINIYAQGVYIDKIPIDEFTSGTLHFLSGGKKEAFHAARSICREKTDPDLRR